MKQILLFLILLSSTSIVSTQNDTIFLKVDEVVANANEQVCVQLRAQDFNQIAGLQLAFYYDPMLLQFDSLKVKGLGKIRQGGFSNRIPGNIFFTWTNVAGVTLADESSLLEICFTALTDVDTRVAIKPATELALEAVHRDLYLVAIKTEEGVFGVTVSGDSCEEGPLCLTNLSVNFDRDTVEIWPRDLLNTNISNFLNCTKSNLEDVYLINLSNLDPEPMRIGKLFCGNLRDTVYIGIAIKTPETEQYWVHCIVPVYVSGIRDQSCYVNRLSPSDPSICRDVEIAAVAAETSISPDQLLDLSTNPDVFYNYADLDRKWLYNSDLEQTNYSIDCPDYNVPQSLNTWLVIAPPESPPNARVIVVQDFCTHEVLVTGGDDVCNGAITAGESELRIENLKANEKVDFFLNGIQLDRLANGSYRFDVQDLIAENNVISYGPLLEGVDAQVTSLDLVTIAKALREDEELDSYQVIGADADRSGSVSTKDFVAIWEHILGIRNLSDAGGFLAPPIDLFETLDYLNFDNSYEDYRFDKNDLNAEVGIDLSVGLIGDVYKTKSAKTKNRKELILHFSDQFVKKGERIDVDIKVQGNQHLSAIFFGLDKKNISIKSFAVNGSKKSTLTHNAGKDFRLSYIDVDNKEQLSFQLEIIAYKDGLLSDLMVLSDYNHEAVDLMDLEYELKLMKEEGSGDLKIYPNPISDLFTIEVPAEFVGGEINITNIIGAEIMRDKIYTSSRSFSKADLAGPGMYVATVTKGHQTKILKLLIH